MIQNTSSLPGKTLTIVGAGRGRDDDRAEHREGLDRPDFRDRRRRAASDPVVFQALAIEGGIRDRRRHPGRQRCLGGGMLIDGGTVSMTSVP